MQSHSLLLLIFAFFVALVFGTLLRDEPRAQAHLTAIIFGALVTSAIVLGWLMYPFPL